MSARWFPPVNKLETCFVHSDRRGLVACPYPSSGADNCHQCGRPIALVDGHSEPPGAKRVYYCGDVCANAWIAMHPEYFTEKGVPKRARDFTKVEGFEP